MDGQCKKNTFFYWIQYSIKFYCEKENIIMLLNPIYYQLKVIKHIIGKKICLIYSLFNYLHNLVFTTFMDIEIDGRTKSSKFCFW